MQNTTQSARVGHPPRYFGSSLGRFMSPDPGNAGADSSNPQSWNMYSYVLNNPLIFTDPTGENCVWDDGTSDADDDPMYGNFPQGQLNCANQGGTWIASVTGDWNPNPDPDLAYQVHDIQTTPPSQTVYGSDDTLEPDQITILGGVYNRSARAADYMDRVFNTMMLGLISAGVADTFAPLPGEPVPATTEVVAADGTRVTGFTRHGLNRAVGDGQGPEVSGARAGTTPQAILDAVKNPERIERGVDSQGRPFSKFVGRDAQVIVNPQTGQIVSVNPLTGAGAH